MTGVIQVEKAEGKEIAETIGQREYLDESYDTLSDAQKLDLFLPEEGSGPFPLVLFSGLSESL